MLFFAEDRMQLRKAMREDIFTFEGEYYQVPPRMLVPKPLQKPYPVIGIAATIGARTDKPDCAHFLRRNVKRERNALLHEVRLL